MLQVSLDGRRAVLTGNWTDAELAAAVNDRPYVAAAVTADGLRRVWAVRTREHMRRIIRTYKARGGEAEQAKRSTG